MKVKVTCDSTVDLSQDLVEKYGLTIIPLTVSLGDDDFLDGVNVKAENIFDYYDKTGALPKTAARSIEAYKDLFKEWTDQGYEVVHISISSEMSASFNNSRLAAMEVPGVYPVDSQSLSTGGGLLVIYASELAQSGKYSAEQIQKKVEARVPFVQASFIIGNMKFLYKGGRCSAVAMFGANLLKIKPSIIVEDGKLRVDKKYMGSMQAVLVKYVKDILDKFNNPDKKRIFITYSSDMGDIPAMVKDAVLSIATFQEVLETRAGATITGHCGKNTLGILFINDGEHEI